MNKSSISVPLVINELFLRDICGAASLYTDSKKIDHKIYDVAPHIAKGVITIPSSDGDVVIFHVEARPMKGWAYKVNVRKAHDDRWSGWYDKASDAFFRACNPVNDEDCDD